MTANPRGGNYLAAGSYGREQRSTGCRKGNNPWGHPAGCSCRASQIVPYMCPASVCDRVDHAECWREYSRAEDERKYRSE